MVRTRFKYGVTGAWVTGLEAVIPPGTWSAVGGPIRKDVAGYDLEEPACRLRGRACRIVTAAWLRLLQAPEAALPVGAFYADAAAGCDALGACSATALTVAALEFLDAATLELAGRAFPGGVPRGAGFTRAGGGGRNGWRSGSTARRAHRRSRRGRARGRQPRGPGAVAELWRWRDGVSIAVGTARGGKGERGHRGPLDRLGEAVAETVAIGAATICRLQLGTRGRRQPALDVPRLPRDEDELARADVAAGELFALAVRLGGSISGEHGVGWLKLGQLERQWSPRALQLHSEIKRVFDPRGLLQPRQEGSLALDPAPMTRATTVGLSCFDTVRDGDRAHAM